MKKYLLITITGLLFLGACKKDDIMVYDTDSYIHFKKTFADSSLFTFVILPNATDHDYPIEVALVGRPVDYDRNYKVEVVESYTTAPAGNYRLPESFVLKKNTVKDTFYVNLVRTPDLEEKSLRLGLRVVETSDFKVGETERSAFVLWFTDKISRPAWWDSTIQGTYLGAYSDKKYRLFMEVTGIADMTGMEPYDIRYYTIIFKSYLREEKAAGRTVYEADNSTEMTVALIGG